MPLDIIATQVISITDSGQEFHFISEVTPSGNYPAGGELLATCTTAGGDLFRSVELNKSTQAAKALVVTTCPTSVGGEVLYLWSYDKANNALKCFLASTGVELAAGAYPADVTGGVTTIQGWFQKK